MDSFKKQFPDYELIPDKTPKWRGPLLAVLALALTGALIYGLMRELGRASVPVANVSGYNAQSANTLKNLALSQLERGQHAEAARNFAIYFQLGGNEPEAMAGYASTLKALGQTEEARTWESRASKFLQDSLSR